MSNESPKITTGNKISTFLFWLAGIIPVISVTFLLYHSGIEAFANLSPNEWGDFLAGIFGPSALAVLAASYLLQKDELKLQREELKLTRNTLAGQGRQLSRTADENRRQSQLLEAQTNLDRKQTFLNSWQHAQDQLRGWLPRLVQNLAESDALSRNYEYNRLRILEIFRGLTGEEPHLRNSYGNYIDFKISIEAVYNILKVFRYERDSYFRRDSVFFHNSTEGMIFMEMLRLFPDLNKDKSKDIKSEAPPTNP